MRELIIALGLFLFIEGILYALFPSKMRNILSKLNQISNTFKDTSAGWFLIDTKTNI